MLKDKLLRAIIRSNNNNNNNNNNSNNNNDINNRDGNNLIKPKKVIYQPTRNNLSKLKREKIQKSFYKPAKKDLLKSKIEEIKEIICDPIINRDEKKEEIRETLYDPRNNFFQPEKDHYKPVKNGNVFSSNFFEYKNNGQKDKTLSIKDDLDEIKS